MALSDRRSEVTGTLSTAGSAPATGYFIVLFPSDRALWHDKASLAIVVKAGATTTQDLRIR